VPGAGGAAAAHRRDEGAEINATIAVCEFLAELNGALRVDENASAHLARLAIRPTGVVDVAGQMLPSTGVNRVLGIDMEQIAAAAAIGFLGADSLTSVLDDALAGTKRLVGK
jgi:hypothetical protein